MTEPTDETVTLLADLRMKLAAAEEGRYEAVHQLEAFKRNVRGRAVKVWYEQGNWCLEGLNETLETLGLEEYEPKAEVTLTVRVRFDYVPGSCGAAEDLVRNGLTVSWSDEDGDTHYADMTSVDAIDSKTEDTQ
jgi:hypothetical protein